MSHFYENNRVFYENNRHIFQELIMGEKKHDIIYQGLIKISVALL